MRLSNGDPDGYQPPQARPQNIPAEQGFFSPPPPIGQHFSPPSSYNPHRSQPLPQEHRGRSRQRSYEYSEDELSDAPQSRRSSRPKALTRRSSSHPGYSNRQEIQKYIRPISQGRSRRGRYSDYSDSESEDDRIERSSQQSRKPIHPHLKDRFTDSPAGLGAGAVGAVVGGWVARKAQEQTGHEKKGSSSAFLTLLGAAAGGLVVNAVVDRMEEKQQRMGGKNEMRWDGRSNDGNRSRRGSERGGGRRRRDDDWRYERY